MEKSMVERGIRGKEVISVQRVEKLKDNGDLSRDRTNINNTLETRHFGVSNGA
jgi:hypothetical protein